MLLEAPRRSTLASVTPSGIASPSPGAASQILLPPRTDEQVPVFNTTELIPFVVPWQIQSTGHSLVVVVKATFDIVPGQDAVLAKEQLPPSGDVRFDEQDTASLRYSSDFAIFKPKADVLMVGHAYPTSNQAIGYVTLRVGSLQGSLAVFGDRSWGTLGAQSKPAAFERMALRWERAMGGPLSEANPVGRGCKTGVLLPNLERREALVTSPRDTPAPVCFAPIAPEWAGRRSKLGTYDKRWLKQRWPYFPQDFDYCYFNAAPPEMRCPYLRGDEDFSIGGVSPKGATISGRLAGMVPRVFAQYVENRGMAFAPVPLNLDTLWMDADAQKLVLVWRGIINVGDDEASELAMLFVTATRKGESLTVEQARERYVAEGLARGVLKRPAALAQDGVPAAAPALAPPPLPGEEPVGSELPHPAAPVPSRDQVLQWISAGAGLSGRDLTDADLSNLDLRGADLTGGVLARANLSGARLDGAKLSQANLAAVQAQGTSFRGADLTAANLHGASLEAADFAQATLESANLSEAMCNRAVFTSVNASKVIFCKAWLVGARFDQAKLQAGDYTDSHIADASFKEASLDDARLYGAQGERVRLDGASMKDARCDDSRLPNCCLAAVKAQGSSFKGATLTGSDFQNAQVGEANFSRAQLQGTVFNKADAKLACFRKAVLAGAHMLKTNLMQASLEGADLRGADLRGANLFEAETWKARLEGANLQLALVAGSKLAP
jgi:uncharacterized protein YjbI with pentapeptide repeats